MKRPPSTVLVWPALLLCLVCATCATQGGGNAPYAAQAPDQQLVPVQASFGPKAEAAYAYLVSRDALRFGDAQTAVEALARVAELDPEPGIFLELAQLQWRMGLTPESRQTLKRSLEVFPGHPELTLRLARTYLVERRYADAQTSLELALTQSPDDSQLLHALADVYLKTDRFQEAEATLDRIPEDGVTAETLLLRAHAALGSGQSRKAEKLLDRALDFAPDSLAVIFELAKLYERRNDHASAAKLYTRLFDMGETGRDIRFRLIRAKLELNQTEDALQLAKDGPTDFAFLFESARLFLARKAYSQARELLDMLEPEGDNMPELLFFRGLLAYEGDGEVDTALDSLAQIPESSSLYGQALSFRVHILLTESRQDQALALANEGLEKFPLDPDFPELKSIILLDAKQPDQALELLDAALERIPGNPDLLYRKAVALELLGEPEAALESMELVLIKRPDDVEALNFIGYILALLERDLDRALNLVNTALKQRPDSGYILDSKAWVHFKRGEFQDAWLAIQKAVIATPGDPTIWEHYGDIAAAMGKYAGARAGYQTSLRLGPLEPEKIRAKLDALP